MATDHPYYPFMLRALALAELSRGDTCPNPVVGAVLVRDGRIVAEGRHGHYGGPHAEIEALAAAARAGVNPAECVLVVTLEPCAHHGKTPPCTDAVVAAREMDLNGVPDPNWANIHTVYTHGYGLVAAKEARQMA